MPDTSNVPPRILTPDELLIELLAANCRTPLLMVVTPPEALSLCRMTLPLPKPLGMTSLAPLVKVLTWLDPSLAEIVVFPAHELFAFDIVTLPLEVDVAQKIKLNGPEIGPPICPAAIWAS